MKNLILTIALGLFLLTACSKEESLEQRELQTTDSVYVLNQFNEASYWDTMVLNESRSSDEYNSIQRVSITKGHYSPTTRDAMTIEWTGTQTELGSTGRAVIKQSTPNFSFHFNLETECVRVDGNKAVYGGVITQVRELSGDAPDIGEGFRIYFNVIDSNSGGSIYYDQIANKTIFASPSSPSLCNAYLPNDNIWSSQGFSDVLQPGFVKVERIE